MVWAVHDTSWLPFPSSTGLFAGLKLVIEPQIATKLSLEPCESLQGVILRGGAG